MIGRDNCTVIGRDNCTVIGRDNCTVIGRDNSTVIGRDKCTVIGRDNCTMMWHNEHPRTRRKVCQNVLGERAGVHVDVPTHSVSATFSFFFMDEMQKLAIQATNKKGTSFYSKNWKIVDIKLSWAGQR